MLSIMPSGPAPCGSAASLDSSQLGDKRVVHMGTQLALGLGLAHAHLSVWVAFTLLALSLGPVLAARPPRPLMYVRSPQPLQPCQLHRKHSCVLDHPQGEGSLMWDNDELTRLRTLHQTVDFNDKQVSPHHQGGRGEHH